MEQQVLDNFGFLAVDDNPSFARSIQETLGNKEEGLGVDVKCICNGGFPNYTFFEVRSIYAEGKYPFIVLDDDLGQHHPNGTCIMQYLVENHPEGGILLASDTLYRPIQLWRWEQILEGMKDSNWIIGDYSEDVIRKSKELCSEFVDNLHNKEQGIELRNR